MNAAQRQALSGGRWHFHHGPIDCVIGADGEPAALAQSLESAWTRFQGVLTELVAELTLLRTNLAPEPGHELALQGPIARRMVAACLPYAAQALFITPMAAVAGSVAQELIASFMRPGVRRAYVNNGGDIALHLAPGESFDVGLVIDPDPDPDEAARGVDGHFRIEAGSGVRGVATSGWRGRSLSLGIADSVTVLAASAAMADAAATMIANAVNVDDVRIVRAAANAVRDDSDLGELPVTVDVPALEPGAVARALAAGARVAERELAAGRIAGAALCLQGQLVRCPARGFHPSPPVSASPILGPMPQPQRVALAGA